MELTLKTRVLLGLAAVCMCIVAAPLPVPADAPVRSEITAQAADSEPGNAQGARATDTPAAGEGTDNRLEREVVPSLPFTGLDVLTLLGVAVALTLLAWILHRLSAPRG